MALSKKLECKTKVWSIYELKKGVRAEEDFEKTVDSELESLKGLEIGSCLHEDWRKTRLKEDETYEPRWKKVKDKNFKFVELSADWQFENLEAGKVVAGLVGSKTEITPEETEQIASRIHDEWLKRNSWAYDPNYGNPAQAVPYEELSEEEKEKDRAQLKFGVDLNKRIISGEVKKRDLKEKFKSNDEQII